MDGMIVKLFRYRINHRFSRVLREMRCMYAPHRVLHFKNYVKSSSFILISFFCGNTVVNYRINYRITIAAITAEYKNNK